MSEIARLKAFVQGQGKTLGTFYREVVGDVKPTRQTTQTVAAHITAQGCETTESLVNQLRGIERLFHAEFAELRAYRQEFPQMESSLAIATASLRAMRAKEAEAKKEIRKLRRQVDALTPNVVPQTETQAEPQTESAA